MVLEPILDCIGWQVRLGVGKVVMPASWVGILWMEYLKVGRL